MPTYCTAFMPTDTYVFFFFFFYSPLLMERDNLARVYNNIILHSQDKRRRKRLF